MIAIDHNSTNGSNRAHPPTTPTPAASNPRPQPPDTPATPVGPAERYTSLDAIRGFALLGIFPMNIIAFALPADAYIAPAAAGPLSAADRIAHAVNTLLFEQRMLSLFAMLFGAGIVLFATRAARKGHDPTRLHYQRMAWLLVFGLIHAYLLWFGDILVPYAVAGMIAFLFRNASTRTLLATGAAFGLATILLSLAWGALLSVFPAQETTGQAQAIQSGYISRISYQFPQVLFMHLFIYPFHLGPGLLGLMLIGMALFKAGILNATRSARRLLTIAAFTAPPGLTLAFLTLSLIDTTDTSVTSYYFYNATLNLAAAALLATAYASLIAAAVRANTLRPATTALANVGRLAFSNYILQTLIACLIFYRPGLGLFNDFSRAELWPIVIAVWSLQLIVSALYLRVFAMGPLEWLWRSLTYWRLQPVPRTQRPD